MGKIWTNSRRHLVILYTRYTTQFSLRSNLVAPLEIITELGIGKIKEKEPLISGQGSIIRFFFQYPPNF